MRSKSAPRFETPNEEDEDAEDGEEDAEADAEADADLAALDAEVRSRDLPCGLVDL